MALSVLMIIVCMYWVTQKNVSFISFSKEWKAFFLQGAFLKQAFLEQSFLRQALFLLLFIFFGRGEGGVKNMSTWGLQYQQDRVVKSSGSDIVTYRARLPSLKIFYIQKALRDFVCKKEGRRPFCLRPFSWQAFLQFPQFTMQSRTHSCT